jgi:hypothetical protein
MQTGPSLVSMIKTESKQRLLGTRRIALSGSAVQIFTRCPHFGDHGEWTGSFHETVVVGAAAGADAARRRLYTLCEGSATGLKCGAVTRIWCWS